MVTHDEDPILGYHHLELDIRRMYLDSITIGVEVTTFVEGLAVDGDTAFGIATDDLVSWHTDNALDQMTRRALGRHSDELKGLVPRSRIVNRFVLQPAARVREDHHRAGRGMTATAARPPGRKSKLPQDLRSEEEVELKTEKKKVKKKKKKVIKI